MTGAVRRISGSPWGECRSFSHPTDDDQERNDECANLLQATSQWSNHTLAEYSYDRAADADSNGEFHLALEAPLARPVT